MPDPADLAGVTNIHHKGHEGVFSASKKAGPSLRSACKHASRCLRMTIPKITLRVYLPMAAFTAGGSWFTRLRNMLVFQMYSSLATLPQAGMPVQRTPCLMA